MYVLNCDSETVAQHVAHPLVVREVIVSNLDLTYLKTLIMVPDTPMSGA